MAVPFCVMLQAAGFRLFGEMQAVQQIAEQTATTVRAVRTGNKVLAGGKIAAQRTLALFVLNGSEETVMHVNLPKVRS